MEGGMVLKSVHLVHFLKMFKLSFRYLDNSL